MKKALIPALLVACAAFAPCVRNVVECPDPVSEIACAVASPLFWHLWDELLTRELARWTETTSHGGDQPEWRPVFAQRRARLPFLPHFSQRGIKWFSIRSRKNNKFGRVDSEECGSSYSRAGIHPGHERQASEHRTQTQPIEDKEKSS